MRGLKSIVSKIYYFVVDALRSINKSINQVFVYSRKIFLLGFTKSEINIRVHLIEWEKRRGNR